MKNVFEYYDEDVYLAHHGILGQKWGIRRFQNKDGTRTAEGKKRYKNYTQNDLNKDVKNIIHNEGVHYKDPGFYKAVESKQTSIQRIRDNVPSLKKIFKEAHNLSVKLEKAHRAGTDTDELTKSTSKRVNELYSQYMKEYNSIIKQYSGKDIKDIGILIYNIDEDFWVNMPGFGS